jgi:AcrR family transcriptional regulator
MGVTPLIARKRPKQERSQATVESVLEATAQLLVEQGYRRLSTNRIAARAGVSVGSLYHYFPNKDALVVALIRRAAAEQLAALRGALAEERDAPLEELARGIIRASLAVKQARPELIRALILQVPRTEQTSFMREWCRQAAAALLAALAGRAGEVRPKDPELAIFILVRAVFAVLEGVMLERPALLGGEELIEELTALALGYLRPGPARG